jgi:hypothetical protein
MSPPLNLPKNYPFKIELSFNACHCKEKNQAIERRLKGLIAT